MKALDIFHIFYQNVRNYKQKQVAQTHTKRITSQNHHFHSPRAIPQNSRSVSRMVRMSKLALGLSQYLKKSIFIQTLYKVQILPVVRFFYDFLKKFVKRKRFDIFLVLCFSENVDGSSTRDSLSKVNKKRKKRKTIPKQNPLTTILFFKKIIGF